MFKFAAIFSALAVALIASGCKEQTEAEKQEEVRTKMRDTKRESAIKHFKAIAEKYPDDPRAQEALTKRRSIKFKVSLERTQVHPDCVPIRS